MIGSATGCGASRRRLHSTVFSLAAFAVFAGCLGDEFVYFDDHPVPDSVGFDLAAQRLVEEAVPSGPLGAFASRLNSHSLQVPIGAPGNDEETGDPAVFGRIVDVALLSESRVAVLDQLANRVEVFGLDGTGLGGFGGRGDGPGEFDTPIALLVPGLGEVQVLDAAGRVHRFLENGSGDWSFAGRIDLLGFPRDACVEAAAGVTVLHVPAVAPGDQDVVARGVLRVHDRDGSHVRSFGVPYRHSQRLVADRMRRGRVACTQSGHVLLALEGSNRLAGWKLSDGSEAWNAVLVGVHVPRLREVELPDGRPGVGQDLRGQPLFHALTTAEPIDEDHVLVQYQRFRWDEDLGGPYAEAIESWILKASTGEGVHIGEDLPRVASIRDTRVVFIHEDPFPRIEVAIW